MLNDAINPESPFQSLNIRTSKISGGDSIVHVRVCIIRKTNTIREKVRGTWEKSGYLGSPPWIFETVGQITGETGVFQLVGDGTVIYYRSSCTRVKVGTIFAFSMLFVAEILFSFLDCPLGDYECSWGA